MSAATKDAESTQACPHCDNMIIHLRKGRTMLRLHGAIEFDERGAHAKCHWCKGGVDLPLTLRDESIQKSRPRLVIRSKK